VRIRAEALARDVGLPEASWNQPIATLTPAGSLRVRFGRAIALDPSILLLEHASASLARAEVAGLGGQLREIAARRGIALVALAADEAFARGVAGRVLTLEPATGRLKPQRRGWFSPGSPKPR
jgi:alpha-D-ribose 1-methylphosphonate 5-triphosphate synthase subunit PhnL